jgi:hypothetical protein
VRKYKSKKEKKKAIFDEQQVEGLELKTKLINNGEEIRKLTEQAAT